MNKFTSWMLLILGATWQGAGAAPDERLVDQARLQAAYVRGLAFTNRVPAGTLTSNVLNDILTRELEEEYDGGALEAAQELYTRWLGILPADFDLEDGIHQIMQEQVAGLYDQKTKTLYVSPEAGSTGPVAAAEAEGMDLPIVLVHELQHALEDQHFNFEAVEEARQDDEDGLLAYQCVVEGSATRGMIEAMPAIAAAESGQGDMAMMMTFDNLLRLPASEWFIMKMMSDPSALMEAEGVKATADIPDVMYRQLIAPYIYGYQVARTFSRDYGNDALDRLFVKPPASSEQVIHPEKYWEWRDLPVGIAFASNLPTTKAWTLWQAEAIGEADIQLIFDHHLGNGRGAAIGAGWDGGRIGLYRNAGQKRLLVWETVWDSEGAARRFESACLKVWKQQFQAARRPGAPAGSWQRPDGRTGLLRRDGARVCLLETDAAGGLREEDARAVAAAVRLAPPVGETARANALLRFNPLLAYKRDADYWTMKALGGILWRHDGNEIGARDQVLAGWIFRSARSKTYREATLLHGWALKHRADARRDYAVTTVLPWGLLWDDAQTRNPMKPEEGYRKNSMLWSLLSSYQRSGGDHTFRLLPWGLLFRHDRAQGQTTIRVLGLPVYRK